MDFMNLNVDFIKTESDKIVEEGSPTSHCDTILQYGIVKQEAEYASAIKYEPATLANSRSPKMDLMTSDVNIMKFESETFYKEGSPTSHCNTILQYGIVKQEEKYPSEIKYEPAILADYRSSEVNLMTSDVGLLKFKPETIPKEGRVTSNVDAIFQHRNVKQEAEDASAIKCQLGTVAAEELAQDCSANFEKDIKTPSILVKDCFVHLERIDISQGNLLINFSGSLSYQRMILIM